MANVRNFPHTPIDYRQIHKNLRLVTINLYSKFEGQTDTHKQMGGQTLPSTLSPNFASDKDSILLTARIQEVAKI